MCIYGYMEGFLGGCPMIRIIVYWELSCGPALCGNCSNNSVYASEYGARSLDVYAEAYRARYPAKGSCLNA